MVSGIGYHWLFLDRVPDFSPYFAIGVLASLNFAMTFTAIGAYRFRTLINFKRQACDVTLVWIGVFLLLLGIAFSLKIEETLSRGATFGFLFIGLLLLVVWRIALAHLLAKALANRTFASQKTIIIGERPLLLASRVLPELRRYGYTPRAVFEIGENDYSAAGISKRLLGKLDLAIRAAREEAIDNVLLFISWEHSHCIEAILNALSVLPVRVHLVPDEKTVSYLRRTCCVGDIWTAELKRAPLDKLEQALKRTLDIFGAGAGILLLSPLMLATALLIKLDSRGPVLFTQWRSGFNGRLFRIFKFRSMSVLEDGPIVRQATREDPRFTSLGRWLRRANIDELPQLFNVLRGEMSLVGPRPHAVAHDSEYERRIAVYAFRYHVKPGITGWAQFNGYRGETRTLDLMSKRVELDLWYIKHWSIWLDFKIIFGTLTREVWRSRGY